MSTKAGRAGTKVGRNRPRRSYSPNIFGISELLKDAVPLLEAYDAMDLEENDDVDRRRGQVKDRLSKINEDEAMEGDEEFCKYTIGICCVMMNHVDEAIEQALTNSAAGFEKLADEIAQRSPKRRSAIAEVLDRALNAFSIIGDDAPLMERASAYGRVNSILHDALEEIDKEEQEKKRREVRKDIGRLLAKV